MADPDKHTHTYNDGPTSVMRLRTPDQLSTWTIVTKAALRDAQVYDLVMGIETKPPVTAIQKTRAWNSKASKAYAMIIKRLHESQIPHIDGIDDDPIAMWARILQMNRTGGFSTHKGLWDKFDEAQFTKGMEMSVHIANMRSIASELTNRFKDKPSSMQFISKLIRSLPTSDPDWRDFSRSLDSDMMADDLEHVIERCLQEYQRQNMEKERRRRVDPTYESPPEEINEALMANFRQRKQGKEGKGRLYKRIEDLKCYRCQGTGHRQDQCPSPADIDKGKAGAAGFVAMPGYSDEEDSDDQPRRATATMSIGLKAGSAHFTGAIGDSDEEDWDEDWYANHPNVAM